MKGSKYFIMMMMMMMNKKFQTSEGDENETWECLDYLNG